MKKIISLVLALVMVFSLCACGSGSAELEARVAELEKENAELKQAAVESPTPTITPVPTTASTPAPTSAPYAEILGEYIFDFMIYMNELKSKNAERFNVAVPLKTEFDNLGSGEWYYSGETDLIACSFYALTETEDIDSKLLRVGVNFWPDQFKDNSKTTAILAVMLGMVVSFDKLASIDDATEIITKVLDSSSVTVNGIKWEINSSALKISFQGTLTDDDADSAVDSESVPERTSGIVPSSTNAAATTGEKNALRAAKEYLNVTAFSYTGLIEQLKYDGYSDSEAKYGADNCGANWKEQAAKSAKQYLGITSFSRSGLIEQLVYDGYTQTEAEYGVTQAGY